MLVCGLDGAVRDVIGAADAAGFANGAFEDTELDSPQGLAIAGDTLLSRIAARTPSAPPI